MIHRRSEEAERSGVDRRGRREEGEGRREKREASMDVSVDKCCPNLYCSRYQITYHTGRQGQVWWYKQTRPHPPDYLVRYHRLSDHNPSSSTSRTTTAITTADLEVNHFKLVMYYPIHSLISSTRAFVNHSQGFQSAAFRENQLNIG